MINVRIKRMTEAGKVVCHVGKNFVVWKYVVVNYIQ